MDIYGEEFVFQMKGNSFNTDLKATDDLYGNFSGYCSFTVVFSVPRREREA